MAAVLWTFVIVFFTVALLTRKPAPPPQPVQLCCPYCKRRANRIKFSFECSDCGETVIGAVDLNSLTEVARASD